MFRLLYGEIVAAATLTEKPDASSPSSSKNKLEFLRGGQTLQCVVDGCLSDIVHFTVDLSQLSRHIFKRIISSTNFAALLFDYSLRGYVSRGR